MQPIKRKSIRGLILTPEQRVLLLKIAEPNGTFRVWLTPGGGILEGESTEDCLRREIEEETGLSEFTIGPQLWTREHTFTWGDEEITQKELYYLIKVNHFTPNMENNPDSVEKVTDESRL